MAQKDTDLPIYLFHEGNNCESDKLFAPIRINEGKKSGWRFRLWAPSALSVSVVGNFNCWDRDVNPMTKVKGSGGIWETFVPDLKVYEVYKYSVEQADGKCVLKADPYALHAETAPYTASKLYESDYKWGDSKWLSDREGVNLFSSPVNIYELHLGSWRRHSDGNIMSYRDIAVSLRDYVKEMGYTHVEIMPVTEYPFEGSWGYQVSGMFAPTSRYGTPDDFRYFVDTLHKAGIGVILDWVAAHFPKDAFALGRFDGTPLYEDPDPTRGEHPDWGTYIFNFGRREVRNFLVADACFWLDEYHIDGLRVDAVSSMLYLDYSREPGQWHPNKFGGRENLEAIDFIKEANATAYKNNPGIVMIAEESTAYPGVTAPTDQGGLGYGLKWNMGWMHDTLEYLHEQPINRKWHHDEITFSMVYAYSEHYVLPISHDEVVYGKGSLFGKMPGDDWQRYAGVRALFAYQWAHPGKNLSFMGNELAQYGEWDYNSQLDWNCLNWPDHRGVQDLVCDLNKLYVQSPALWSQDFTTDGFQWLTSDDSDHNVLSFMRIGKNGEQMVVVVNFSGTAWQEYQVPLPQGGRWREVLTTDDKKYGGSDIHNTDIEANAGAYHSRDWSTRITVPALGAVFLVPDNQ